MTFSISVRSTRPASTQPSAETAARRAFTLVELLVVIGIIALLISILLPTLNSARNSAKQVQCLSNIRQQMTGAILYANDQDGMLPPARAGMATNYRWSLLIMKYLGEGDGTQDGRPGDNSKLREVFQCPDANVVPSPIGNSVIHYSAHPLLMPNADLGYPGGHPLARPGLRRVPYKLGSIKSSAEKVTTFDGTQIFTDNDVLVGAAYGNAVPDGFNLDWQRIANGSNGPMMAGYPYPPTYLVLDTVPGAEMGLSVDGGLNQDYTPGTAGVDRKHGNIRWRHMDDKVGVFSFADGHAESLKYIERGKTELKRINVHIHPVRP